MKYKVGDKVKIISAEVYENNKGLMSPTHSLACGKIFTIKDIVICSLDGKERYLFEDNDPWTKGSYWKDCMIEGLVEGETIPKFKVGDKVKDKNNRVWFVVRVGETFFDISSVPNAQGYFVPIVNQDDYELIPQCLSNEEIENDGEYEI